MQDMSLKSKAELQLTKNKLIEIKAEIGNLERQISEKGVLIDRQDKINTELTQ